MHKVEVQVGLLLEITAAEADELYKWAAQMKSAACLHYNGWLTEYFRAHTEAARVMDRLIARSHASAAPVREVDPS